jgi:RimJ/RimL family protein N-acetyltransferase
MPKVDLRGGPHGVRLERAGPKHAAALRDGFNSGAAAASTRWHLPHSLSAMNPKGQQRYAIMRDERLIGTCRLSEPQYAGLELAIVLFNPRERGRGAGTFAVSKMCEIAFATLETHRVELGVYPDNAAAIRVYEKCGFEREALLRRYVHHEGEWRDLVWMAILKRDWLAANGGRR